MTWVTAKEKCHPSSVKARLWGEFSCFLNLDLWSFVSLIYGGGSMWKLNMFNSKEQHLARKKHPVAIFCSWKISLGPLESRLRWAIASAVVGSSTASSFEQDTPKPNGCPEFFIQTHLGRNGKHTRVAPLKTLEIRLNEGTSDRWSA